MRNSIGWKFVSLPRDHQKEAKLKWHLVKGKWFAKKEKKKQKHWIMILCFTQI